MIHSILISEVKVKFCWHFEKLQTKKTLKFHVELNFKNFLEKKMEKLKVECYNIFTLGIDIIRFHMNIISELDF